MTTMTQADFARAHGVSRSAVTQWKERGFIVLLGDLIDVEASDSLLQSRRTGRFNSRKPTGQRRELNEPVRKAVAQLNTSTTQLAAEVSGAPYQAMGPWDATVTLNDMTGLPLEVDAAASAIEMGAFTMAVLLLADGIRRQDVERLVERWVGLTRFHEATGLDDEGDLAPPFGCKSWKQALPFVRPWMADSNTSWDEVEQDAANLRAAAAGAPGAHS